MAQNLGTGYISLSVKYAGAMDRIAQDITGIGKKAGPAGAAAGKTLGDKLTGGISQSITGKIPGIGKMLVGNLARFAPPLAAAFSIGTIVQKGMGRLQAIDEASAKLRGLGNDADTVKSIMDSALKSVQGTAYGLGEAAGLAGTLVASGIKPGQDLDRVLGRVADSAAQTGRPLEEMGVIWAKVAAKGKVDGQIINQMLLAQVPIYDILAEQMNVNKDQVADMVRKGQVDFNTFSDAMDKKLGGSAKKAGETFRGAMDNVNAALARLGAALLKPVFNKFAGWANAAIVIVDKLTAVVGPAFETIGKVIGKAFENLPDLGSIFAGLDLSGLAARFGPLVAEIGTRFTEGFAEIMPKLISLGRSIADAVVPLIQSVLPHILHVGQLLGEAFRDAVPVVMSLIGRLAEAFERLLPRIVPILQLVAERSRNVWHIVINLGKIAIGILGPALHFLIGAFEKIAPYILNVYEAFVKWGQAIIVSPIGKVAEWLAKQEGLLKAIGIAIGVFVLPKLILSTTAWALNAAAVGGQAAATAIYTVAIKAYALAQNIANGAVWKFTAALLANPIGLIVVGIAALIAALVIFFTKTELGRKIWAATWDWIKRAASNTWNFLKGMFSAIGRALSGVINFFKKWWQILLFGMGPVGVVIGIVVQLIKHWDKVKAVLATGWNVIKTVFTTTFNVIKSIIEGVGKVILWLWQNVVQPTFTAIKFAIQVFLFPWRVMAAVIKASIDPAGKVIMWLWQSVIQPAFNGIRTVVGAVVGFLVGRFNNLVNNIKIAANWFSDLWKKYVVPAWDGIKSAFSTAWGVIQGVYEKIKGGVDAVGQKIMALWNTYVVPAWEGIKSAFQSAFDFINSILEKIKSVFGNVGDAIKTIATGIGDAVKNAFAGAADAMKGPLRTIGRILSSMPQSIAGVPIPGAGTIQNWGNSLQGLAAGGKATRTRGGLLRGPGGPLSDSILGVGRDGMPTARVSAGEGVVRASAMDRGGNAIVKALNAGWIPSAQFMQWMVPGLQRGGRVAQAVAYAKKASGRAYDYGGTGGGGRGWDCSGIASSLYNILVGKSPSGRSFTTESDFAGLGFKTGFAKGQFNIGVMRGGGGRLSHMAVTLPNGVNVESGGAHGTTAYGPPAKGAKDFPLKWFLPITGGDTGRAGAATARRGGAGGGGRGGGGGGGGVGAGGGYGAAGGGAAGAGTVGGVTAELDEFGDEIGNKTDDLGSFDDALEGTTGRLGDLEGESSSSADQMRRGDTPANFMTQNFDELFGKAGELTDIAYGGLVENLPPGFSNPADWPVMKSIAGVFSFFAGKTNDPTAKALLGGAASIFGGQPGGAVSAMKGLMPKPYSPEAAKVPLAPEDFMAYAEPMGGSIAAGLSDAMGGMVPEPQAQNVDQSIHIGENGTVGQDPAAVADNTRRQQMTQRRGISGTARVDMQ